MLQKRGPQPGEGGAPHKVIDLDVARRAASIGCTRDEIAALLGISRAALFAHLQENEEFRDEIETGMNTGRATLRRKQWQRAMDGSDTMLIWLGKQFLGQKDRAEIGGDPDRPLTYVVRTPSPIESAQDWLKAYAPRELLEADEIEGHAEPDIDSGS